MKLSKAERVKKFGEVFTPAKTVREMCDMLEEESPECFEPERTFLEPSCGDGAFVAEILRRKFDRCKRRRDYTVALESVYGFEIQADNVEKCIQNITILCCQYFRPTQGDIQIINDHIIQCDALKVMKLLTQFDH